MTSLEQRGSSFYLPCREEVGDVEGISKVSQVLLFIRHCHVCPKSLRRMALMLYIFP